jgi:uncharacterized membrane protein
MVLEHTHTQEVIQTGPLPVPADLEKYNLILPGAAERIFAQWERETTHRQEMDRAAQLANIDALQKRHEFIVVQGGRAHVITRYGQLLGFAAYSLCIAGAVFSAFIGSDWRTVAALAAIPSAGAAAVIYAFFGRNPKEKTEKQTQ